MFAFLQAAQSDITGGRLQRSRLKAPASPSCSQGSSHTCSRLVRSLYKLGTQLTRHRVKFQDSILPRSAATSWRVLGLKKVVRQNTGTWARKRNHNRYRRCGRVAFCTPRDERPHAEKEVWVHQDGRQGGGGSGPGIQLWGERRALFDLAVRFRADLRRRSMSNCPYFGYWARICADANGSANEKGTQVYKVQKRFQKMFGFTLPLFHGRG